MIGDVFSMFLAIAGTIFVILLTYYGSRWYAGKMSHVAGGKHIKIIDRLVISNTGSILIIEIQELQYMIGISDKNIQMLQKLEEPIRKEAEVENSKDNFLEVFKSMIQKGNKNENI